MTHKVEAVKKPNQCEPSTPAPQQTDDRMCEGIVRMECCCPCLQTRTFIVAIGPQTEASLQSFLQGTVNAYETAGYLILGHSLVDAGAGWMLGLTVGWYA